jgi:tripartite-type tricarboxylate transporter receptor subunit TctC
MTFSGRITRRGLCRAVLAISAAFALAGIAPVQAQGWPDKPITIIVPFPAGGGTDTFARPLAAQLDGSINSTLADFDGSISMVGS